MSIDNLRKLYAQADEFDIKHASQAYFIYNEVMRDFASKYRLPVERVTAVFCALSPNSDYYGNLRSLSSVLHGFTVGMPVDRVTVSTYKHCRDRAWTYLHGEPFITRNRGRKIRSFYLNVMYPEKRRVVTVDGHMKAAYLGEMLTMKEAQLRSGEYDAIENAVKQLARSKGMIPSAMQAVPWYVRKRIYRIKFDPQLDMLKRDVLGIYVSPDEAPPYRG